MTDFPEHAPTTPPPTPKATMDPAPISNISAALCKAHLEIHNPTKNRTVTVQPREGRAYQFAYATLDGILDGVRPILARNGICIVQTLLNDEKGYPTAVRTMLLHTSGESIHADVPMHLDREGNQALGSAMTYARRYGLSGLLALAAEEDDDGNAADGNKVEDSRERHPTGRQADPMRVAESRAVAAAAAPARTTPNSDAVHMRQQHAAIMVDLNRKMGAQEAAHQAEAIKKRNGTNYTKALAELRALADSTPEPRA